MLYHVTFQIDQQGLGFEQQRKRIAAAEKQAFQELRAGGVLKGLWDRADNAGSIFVVDATDHDSLSTILQSQPIFPYLKNAAVMPIVAHSACAD